VAEPAGAASPAAPARERLAAIDVGSNSIRLVIAELDPAAGLTIIDELKDQPRLAAGLARTGRLDPAAVDRAMQTLGRMRDVCRRRGVRRIAAVATAAVREAENGEDFVARVRGELDIPLRVIAPEVEASLSYRSVAHHFPLAGARTLVADIGGGSLELVGAVDGLVELSASFPLGAVRLTELFFADGASVDGAVRKLRTSVRRRLKRESPLRDGWRGANIIGSGGTFTSLGRMVVARRGFPVPETAHGVIVTTAEVEQLLEWLTTLPPDRRRAVPGLNPQRADIILAGLAVTAELLTSTDARGLTVSAFGLREGLLLEMAGAGRIEPADPLRMLREFAERCQSDRRHVEQVRHLALQLFEQLAPALGAAPEERAILEAASLLHDVGQLVSYRRHHKHSYQLIMHAERLSLSARDRALVALISRYHRKTGPKKQHEEYAALPKPERAVVMRMSALLRIADGLDRGHTAIVERVDAELTDDRLTLRVLPRLAGADLALECWGASRKSDVLADALGREVVVEPGLATDAPRRRATDQ
jgi:exopolyphosphatase/guanosine-5'-triphosphate,3'-diphosphate pyrophosphatase